MYSWCIIGYPMSQNAADFNSEQWLTGEVRLEPGRSLGHRCKWLAVLVVLRVQSTLSLSQSSHMRTHLNRVKKYKYFG